MKINFPFMLVENSIWPLTTAISTLSMLLSSIMIFNKKIGGFELFIISIISILISIYYWFKDIIVEATFQGYHNKDVQTNINIGFILFVVSEAMIFFSFFFAFFYNSLIPSIFVGAIWPPVGIETLDATAIPLLNTVILFMSGISVTASQHYIVAKNRSKSILYLAITIILGIIFLCLQVLEYKSALFTIADSVYGASFFLLTGFHGFHVLIGVLFLIISLLRLYNYHYSENHFLNATFSSIYYHFVDVIWIFLFAVIYCWSSGL